MILVTNPVVTVPAPTAKAKILPVDILPVVGDKGEEHARTRTPTRIIIRPTTKPTTNLKLILKTNSNTTDYLTSEKVNQVCERNKLRAPKFLRNITEVLLNDRASCRLAKYLSINGSAFREQCRHTFAGVYKINHKFKIGYLMVPKAGSTAVRKSLKEMNFGKHMTEQAMSISLLEKLKREKVKFITVVRDPMIRFIKAISEIEKTHHVETATNRLKNLLKYFQQLGNSAWLSDGRCDGALPPDFDEIGFRKSLFRDEHLFPQSLLIFLQQARVNIDAIFKQEHLPQEMSKFVQDMEEKALKDESIVVKLKRKDKEETLFHSLLSNGNRINVVTGQRGIWEQEALANLTSAETRGFCVIEWQSYQCLEYELPAPCKPFESVLRDCKGWFYSRAD